MTRQHDLRVAVIRLIPGRLRYFDLGQPRWFRYGPLIGSVLGALVIASAFLLPSWWRLITLLPILLIGAVLTFVIRWQRLHGPL